MSKISSINKCVHFSLISILTTTILSTSSYAVRKPVVAVFDFKPENVSTEIAVLSARNMRNSLIDIGKVEVIDRDAMASILKTQGENLEPTTEDRVGIKLGKLLDADLIVLGEVTQIGDLYTISARLIDLETGRYVVSKSIPFYNNGLGEQQFFQAVPKMAKMLSEGFVLKATIIRITDEGNILIDAGKGLVKTGDKLMVKRYADKFAHPGTGEIMYDIREVGEVTVSKVIEFNLASCVPVQRANFRVNDFIELTGHASGGKRGKTGFTIEFSYGFSPVLWFSGVDDIINTDVKKSGSLTRHDFSVTGAISYPEYGIEFLMEIGYAPYIGTMSWNWGGFLDVEDRYYIEDYKLSETYGSVGLRGSSSSMVSPWIKLKLGAGVEESSYRRKRLFDDDYDERKNEKVTGVTFGVLAGLDMNLKFTSIGLQTGYLIGPPSDFDDDFSNAHFYGGVRLATKLGGL